MREVEVWRGRHGDPVPLFGPLPGVRDGDALTYEFELPKRFPPWPGRTSLQRVFALLDLGVSMSLPAWRPSAGYDRDATEPSAWYVDLVHVTTVGDTITLRDLYIDVIVPFDGRHHRELDLDEYGDAMEAGELDLGTAIDGLRRWQRFLDRHLHAHRDPQADWTDFPPKQFRDLEALPVPLGPIVTAPE
jgi:hypothetical protein